MKIFTPATFFQTYIINPLSQELSTREKVISLMLSISSAVCFFGIAHIVAVAMRHRATCKLSNHAANNGAGRLLPYQALFLLRKNAIEKISTTTLLSNRSISSNEKFQIRGSALLDALRATLIDTPESKQDYYEQLLRAVRELKGEDADRSSSQYNKTFQQLAAEVDVQLKALFVKETDHGKIITPLGLSYLCDNFQRRGKIVVPCTVCAEKNQFSLAMSKLLQSDKDETRAFLLKSANTDHITPIYVQKVAEEIRVFQLDTQGGQPNFDSTALKILYALNPPNLKIYNLVERRQMDRNSCPTYAIEDIAHLSKIPNLFGMLEEKAQTRGLKRINLLSAPFKPIYLSDLPLPLIKYTAHVPTLERLLQKGGEIGQVEKVSALRIKLQRYIAEVVTPNKTIRSNRWALHRNDVLSQRLTANFPATASDLE